MSWPQFIRRAKAPELPVVLLEDVAALIGLVFALLGVGLTVITGNGVWDGIGTVLIGAPARHGRDHPRHRDEEPARRRGRDRRGRSPPSSEAITRRRRGRAHHPHEDAVPRAGRAAGRAPSSAFAGEHRWPTSRPRSTSSSAASATPCRSPASSTSSPTSGSTRTSRHPPPTPSSSKDSSDPHRRRSCSTTPASTSATSARCSSSTGTTCGSWTRATEDVSAIDPSEADLVVVLGGEMGAYQTDEFPFLEAEHDAAARPPRRASGRPSASASARS